MPDVSSGEAELLKANSGKEVKMFKGTEFPTDPTSSLRGVDPVDELKPKPRQRQSCLLSCACSGPWSDHATGPLSADGPVWPLHVWEQEQFN